MGKARSEIYQLKAGPGKAENPKKLGHDWQGFARTCKALMFREVRHLILPLCYTISNDNTLQARRSLETAGFHSGSFPQ